MKLVSRFNIRMIIVKVVKKLVKFFFPMCANKEIIINISKLYLWLRFLAFKKLSFYFIHKNESISRSKFNFVFNFAIKLKVVILSTNSAILTR